MSDRRQRTSAVLGRLSEGQKLAAVSVVLALPLLVMSVAYGGVQNRRLVAGRQERVGVEYLVPLTRLLIVGTAARHALASGDRPDTEAVTDAVTAVERVRSSRGARLGASGSWRRSIMAIDRAVATTEVAAGVRTYDEAIDDIKTLMTQVSDPAMDADGGADTYWVMKTVMLYLPILLDLPMRVIDDALVKAPGGRFGGPAWLAGMAAMAGRTQVVSTSVEISLGRAFAATGNSDLLALRSRTAQMLAAHRSGAAYVLQTASAGAALVVQPQMLTTVTTRTGELITDLLPVLTRLIDTRIHDLRYRLYGVSAATGLALLLAAYVLLVSIRQIRGARDQAVASAEASAAFLATMSHEIRTPMNAVIGMTGLLLDTRLEADQRRYATTVRDSGEALLCIINDILDYSKVESGQMELDTEPFDLHDCVDGALALVALQADRKGLELVSAFEAGCPRMLCGDVTRVRQILANLLSNAVKFTADGEIVVTTGTRPRADLPGQAVELRISVRDTGPGIPSDRMDRVFRSFAQVDASTTRQHGGTGLGMAISRRLARAMRGDLTVTSQVGVGSTFTLTALLAECPDAEVPAGAGAAVAGSRALIVDDNATNRQVVRLQLTGWGMTCHEAASASGALELVAAGHTFDVALLDHHMSEMDGVELADALRNLPQTSNMPLLLLSSISQRPQPEHQALFTASLTKPVRATDLHTELQRALGPATEPVAASTRPCEDAPALPPLRIMLADDNPVNQQVGQLLLAKIGYRVDTVGDGLEALHAAQRTAYDVILMDIQMPTMDGLEATRRIRAALPTDRQPHIIALTASALVEDQAACRAAGTDSYLPKPVRVEDLRAALAAYAASMDRPRHFSGWDSDSAPELAGRPERIEDAIRHRLQEIAGPDPEPDERALIVQLAHSFTVTAPQILIQLQDAVHAGDNPATAQYAHRLTGSASNLGVNGLARICVHLEEEARHGRISGGAGYDPELATATTELNNALSTLTQLETEWAEPHSVST